MKDFDWEDLRHFLALARTLNLAQAALRLGNSQVTVMRRVRAIEHSLDSVLFVRRKDGHRLSALGQKLLVLAEEAEQAMSEISFAVEQDRKEPQGSVRIATTEIAANWLLLPGLSTFRCDHPEIILEIDASPHAADLLDAPETIALRFKRPASGDMVVKRLGMMTFGLYAAASLVETAPERLDYIGWAGPFSDIRPARWLASQFEGRPPILALTTFEGQLAACRQGLGVAAIPTFVGGRFDDLISVLDDAPPLSMEAWLIVPTQSRTSSRVRTTMKFIQHQVCTMLSTD